MLQDLSTQVPRDHHYHVVETDQIPDESGIGARDASHGQGEYKESPSEQDAQLFSQMMSLSSPSTSGTGDGSSSEEFDSAVDNMALSEADCLIDGDAEIMCSMYTSSGDTQPSVPLQTSEPPKARTRPESTEKNGRKECINGETTLREKPFPVQTFERSQLAERSNENHLDLPIESTADTVSTEVFQAHYTNKLHTPAEVSALSESVTSRIAKMRSLQDIRFSIELSDMRTVDVTAQELDDRWNLGFSVKDFELRRKLQQNKDQFAESLRENLGKRVSLNVK